MRRTSDETWHSFPKQSDSLAHVVGETFYEVCQVPCLFFYAAWRIFCRVMFAKW